MSRVKTALSGNHLAMLAMALAVAGQLVQTGVVHPWTMLGGLVAGAVVGAWISIRVKMTQMPEMVGLLNGLGGLASMIVGIATYAVGVHVTPEVDAVGALDDGGPIRAGGRPPPAFARR